MWKIYGRRCRVGWEMMCVRQRVGSTMQEVVCEREYSEGGVVGFIWWTVMWINFSVLMTVIVRNIMEYTVAEGTLVEGVVSIR